MNQRRTSFRWYRSFSLISLLALVASLVPVFSGHAQTTEHDIPKSAVDAGVWITNWREKFSGAERTEKLVLTDFVLQMYRLNPTQDPLRAVEEFQRYQREYDRRTNRGQDDSYMKLKSKDEIIRTLFDVASDMGGGVLASPLKAVYERMMDKWVWKELDAATQVAATSRRHEAFEATRQRESEILQGALDLAKTNGQFATAYDMLFAPDLNASIKDSSAQTVIAKNPGIKVPPRIKNNIQSGGSISISLRELHELSRQEFGNIKAAIDDITAKVIEVDAKVNQLVDWMNDEKRRQEEQAKLAQAAAQHELTLQAAESTLFIVSTFAGLIDEDAGRYISVVGSAAIQIGESLNNWMEAVAGLSALNALGSLSTAVMTGNVLGAVMNIVSLFEEQGPTPEQMILDAIGQLRDQIDTLRREMHSRFDRIDQQLNTIYATVQDRFNRVDLALWRLHGDVREIQSTLIKMELTLSRIERNTYEFLQVAHRSPLLERINKSIGWEETYRIPMPYSEYIESENKFHYWGTEAASDPVNAGPTQRNYADDQVLAELSAFVLDRNINYLNGWLVAHQLPAFHLPALPSERLPSPRDWALAATVYSRLSFEWPEHARVVSSKRKEDLERKGRELRTALNQISTVTSSGTPQGNKALSSGLINYYIGKLGLLTRGIEAHEVSYMQENDLTRSPSFDLWSGVHQSLGYTPAAFATMPRCGTTDSGLSGPANLPLYLTDIYLLADYLKMGSLTTCYTPSWQDVETREIPKSNDETVWARLQVSVDVQYKGQSIHTRFIKGALQYIGSTASGQRADPDAAVRFRWTNSSTNLKARFEASSVESAPSPDLSNSRSTLLAQTTIDSEKKLLDHQNKVYTRIANELSHGALQARAQELGGAKAILDAFISLGFSRAVESDDYLRSFLSGNQHVYDDQLVGATYVLSSTTGLTPAHLRTNARVVIQQVGYKRITALDALLTKYLDAITSRAHEEQVSLVENVLLQLRLSDKLARQGSAPGTGDPSSAPTHPAFNRIWGSTDLAVKQGQVRRSWLWGPQPIRTTRELYAQSPGEQRLVEYYDKSRMEINNPNGDPNNLFFVTNGLLPIELMTGRLKTGDAANQFQQRQPADVPVAGDPATENQDAPTYRSFLAVATVDVDDAPRRAAPAVDRVVVSTLNKAGQVTQNQALAQYNVRIARYDQQLGHNVADVFEQYLGGLTVDALYAMGYAISEPYWAKVRVGGVEKDVLMQAFERRILTFTPSNAEGFKVEMGNVGQHYYRWRYGTAPWER